jgi:hypothetical protein
LLHHHVENRCDTSFGQGWVCHADDCLKVRAGENCFLILDIPELLVNDMDLATRLGVTSAEPDIVRHEVAVQAAATELDRGLLVQEVRCLTRQIVKREFFFKQIAMFVYQLNLLVQNPSVGRSCVEKAAELLWRVSHVKLRDVGIVT